MKGKALARSNFVQRKMMRYFVVLDVDRDGHIEKEDFQRCVDRAANIRGYSTHAPEYSQLQELMLVEWQQLGQNGDMDQDGEISVDEWLQYREDIRNNLIGTGVESAAEVNAEAAKILRGQQRLRIMDFDEDGVVNLEDLINYYDTLNLPKDLAEKVFPKLDNNKQGYLTEQDVIDRFYEFTHSYEPDAPGNWFYGPF